MPRPSTLALLIYAALAAAGHAAPQPASEPPTPRMFLLHGEQLHAARRRVRNGDVKLMPALRRLTLRGGVRERLDAQGAVRVPLDPGSLADAIARLKAEAVEAVAICFLHSYRNPGRVLARVLWLNTPPTF